MSDVVIYGVQNADYSLENLGGERITTLGKLRGSLEKLRVFSMPIDYN